MDLGIILRSASSAFADATPGRPAVSLEGEHTMTYRELADFANRTSNGLLELGIGAGDRVGILMRNGPEYIGAYFGILRLGAVAVRLNWRLKREELNHAITDSGCSLCITDPGQGAELGDLPDDIPGTRFVTIDCPELRDASAAEPRLAPPRFDDPAMIMYTSGTTGRPKGAVWTHGNALSIASMQALAWGWGPETVSLTFGPLFHVGSFEDLTLPALLCRGHAVLTRSGGFEIERTLAVLERERVTDTLLLTTMIWEMVEAPSFGSRDLTSVRRLATGGAPLGAEALARVAEAMPNATVCSFYGLTEGGAIATHAEIGAPTDASNDVGVPMPLAEVRIADDQGAEVGPGAEGEVWVRSAASSIEYWNDPEGSASAFEDGWCKTGDMGYVDAGGHLVVSGRKKDMVKTGGENVYPVEVEAVLRGYPGVEDVAVFGLPDEKFGEAVSAAVLCAPGVELDPDELLAHCASRLAGFKKPRHIVFVDELPRSASGKVQKHLVREAALVGMEGRSAGVDLNPTSES